MIYVIMGPTASSKSDLAIYLHDKLENSIIVNFDAFQIYKHMNIGTAKPSQEELNKGYYFLYDYLDLEESNDIFSYQKRAREIIENNKDKDIIFVGGSGLYIKAALFNYKFNEEPIKMSEDYLSDLSNEELYEKLFKIDQEDALKITSGNRKRLLRALYVYEINGNKTKSELNNNQKNELLYPNTKFIFINPEREKLNELINKRVDIMFEKGLVEEARSLLNNYDINSTKALQAIGYKEFYNSSEKSLEDIKEEIKLNTRRYAKRQVTFFKHQFPEYEEYDSIEEAIKRLQ